MEERRFEWTPVLDEFFKRVNGQKESANNEFRKLMNDLMNLRWCDTVLSSHQFRSLKLHDHSRLFDFQNSSGGLWCP